MSDQGRQNKLAKKVLRKLVERGQLFFRKGQRKAMQEDVVGEYEQQWKLCIKTSKEKERVMMSCHTCYWLVLYRLLVDRLNKIN